jgi:hypothetical protein
MSRLLPRIRDTDAGSEGRAQKTEGNDHASDPATTRIHEDLPKTGLLGWGKRPTPAIIDHFLAGAFAAAERPGSATTITASPSG